MATSKTFEELVNLYISDVTPPNDSYEAWQGLHSYRQGFYRGATLGFEAGFTGANEKDNPLLLVAEWIDAKEAMPPADTWCLVDSDEGVMSAYYHGDDVWSEGGIAWIDYWMPLPSEVKNKKK
jgi:hypothetical protein